MLSSERQVCVGKRTSSVDVAGSTNEVTHARVVFVHELAVRLIAGTVHHHVLTVLQNSPIKLLWKLLQELAIVALND